MKTKETGHISDSAKDDGPHDIELGSTSYHSWVRDNESPYPLINEFLKARPEWLNVSENTPANWSALSEHLKARPGGSVEFTPDFFEPSLESVIAKYLGDEVAAEVKIFAIDQLGYDPSAFDPKRFEWEPEPIDPDAEDEDEEEDFDEVSDTKVDPGTDLLFELVRSGVIIIPAVPTEALESEFLISDEGDPVD